MMTLVERMDGRTYVARRVPRRPVQTALRHDEEARQIALIALSSQNLLASSKLVSLVADASYLAGGQ